MCSGSSLLLSWLRVGWNVFSSSSYFDSYFAVGVPLVLYQHPNWAEICPVRVGHGAQEVIAGDSRPAMPLEV